MAKKRAAGQHNEPTVFTADEMAFVRTYQKTKEPTGLLAFADYLDEQGAPEQQARAEFIRLQAKIESTPLSDRKMLAACKKREKELLKAYGELWAKKDLAAAGFTEQQLEGINPKLITFSYGLADLLAHPEHYNEIKLLHRYIQQHGQRTFNRLAGEIAVLRMLENIESRNMLMERIEGAGALLTKPFTHSGLMMKTFCQQSTSFIKNNEKDLFSHKVLHSPAGLRVLFQNGLSYKDIDDPNYTVANAIKVDKTEFLPYMSEQEFKAMLEIAKEAVLPEKNKGDKGPKRWS